MSFVEDPVRWSMRKPVGMKGGVLINKRTQLEYNEPHKMSTSSGMACAIPGTRQVRTEAIVNRDHQQLTLALRFSIIVKRPTLNIGVY